MQIYLVHPEHGHKIAEMQPEADGDIKNGWKQVTKDQFYDRGIKASQEGTEKESKPEASSKVVEINDPANKKRGRPRNKLEEHL